MTTLAEPIRTVDAIIRELSVLTDEQRSLAWCPCPRYEPAGAHDCRPGGDCGLDFSGETRLSRWRVARYRMAREQRRIHAG
jgi:hypothetical protein